MRAVRWASVFLALIIVVVLGPPATAAPAPAFSWIDQFGSALDDSAWGIALDASGVYVVGSTDGALPGQTSAGAKDAVVRKYDLVGQPLWTRQFGTPADDTAWASATDGGSLYVFGATGGTLPGQASAGATDLFLRRYTATGSEVWTRQFGTSGIEWSYGLAVHSSGVYVAGWTYGALPGQTNAGQQDVFLRKYDGSGNELWTREFGTPAWDGARTVCVDDTGVYVAGFTDGAFPNQTGAGNYDVFVRKYDHNAAELWTRQFGTAMSDMVGGMAGNSTGVYVSGQTSGPLPGQVGLGGGDAFLRKYDPAGNELWTRQFGTSTHEGGTAAFIDASGVYVAGYTFGSFPGYTNEGDADPFVREYDAAGTELWTRQFGTPGNDIAWAVASDGTYVYLAGHAYGSLPTKSVIGQQDAFAMRLGGIPQADIPSNPLSFGSVEVGLSRSQNVTISSIGSAFLMVTDVFLVSGAVGFSIPSAPTTPFYLPPQTAAEVAITFAPATAGAASDTLRISTDDPAGGVVDIPLSGTGIVVPRMDVAPAALSLGPADLGGSASGTVTIRSVGSGSLTVLTISLASGATGFSLPSPPSTPLSLAPGGTVALQVRFSPSAAGPATDELRITSDDPGRGLVVVPLSGAGEDTTAPGIAHTPPGPVRVGDPIPIQATVTDAGGVAEVVLHYRGTQDAGFTAVTISWASGDMYTGSIPAQAITGNVSYYIVARDLAGNEARAPGSGEHIVRVTMTAPPGPEGGLVSDLLLPGVVVLLIAAAIASVVVAAGRRRRGSKDGVGPKTGPKR